MSDNLLLNVGAGGSKLATAQLVFSGDTADFQICSLTILTGAEGAWAQTLIVGGAGVVGAGVQRMTLASDDPAVAKLTTIDVDTGAIATSVATLALETGGHIEEAADHVHSIDGKITACNTGAIVISSGTVTTVTTVTTVGAVTAITNALPAGTNMLGSIIGQQSSSVVYDGATACTIYRASGVAAGGAPGTDALIAADGTRKFRILALFLKATAATLNSVYLATTTDLDVLGNAANPIPLAVDADGNVDSGFVLPWNPGGWTETSTVNEALNLISSAAQDIIWAITYIKVA